MTTTPDYLAHLDEQRAAALARGNAVRRAGATLCRHVATLDEYEGRQHVAAVLDDENLPDALHGSVPIDRLLRSIHLFGPHKSAHVLRYAVIPTASRPLRRLTERQRKAAAFALRNPRVLLSPTRQAQAAPVPGEPRPDAPRPIRGQTTIDDHLSS